MVILLQCISQALYRILTGSAGPTGPGGPDSLQRSVDDIILFCVFYS